MFNLLNQLIMRKDDARKWLENRGYQVKYVMGSYPTPGYYMAERPGPWGRILRGSLNAIVNMAKSIERRGLHHA